MKILKNLFFHYLIGMLISASIIGLIILFDYYVNGYLQYPELSNLIKVCVISGLGFGLTHCVSTKIK
jgi:hypothetical protein